MPSKMKMVTMNRLSQRICDMIEDRALCGCSKSECGQLSGLRLWFMVLTKRIAGFAGKNVRTFAGNKQRLNNQLNWGVLYVLSLFQWCYENLTKLHNLRDAQSDVTRILQMYTLQSLSLSVQSKILQEPLKLRSTSAVLLSLLSVWVFGPWIRART